MNEDATVQTTDVVVIGAGQAGLSSAYFLQRAGFEPDDGYVVLDGDRAPGGAWQHRWPSLRMETKPTSLRTRRCLETAGCGNPRPWTMCATGRSCIARKLRILRRCGSATALKASDVVAALAIGE